VASSSDPHRDAALELASFGFAVFPLWPDSKRPILNSWETVARTDLDMVEALWTQWPHANVAVACGPSRLVVLDIDTKNGVDGFATFHHLHGQEWPHSYSVRTPTGGGHIYFADPDGEYRNTAGKLGPGLDTRAVGGYVVGVGSTIGEAAYRLSLMAPIADPPKWMRAKLLTKVVPPQARSWPTMNGSSTFTVDGLVATVAHAVEGERNDKLNWAAYRLGQDTRAGRISYTAALRVLDDLLDAAGQVGLDEEEARATLVSGFNAGSAW
jgi:hypothetical protein